MKTKAEIITLRSKYEAELSMSKVGSPYYRCTIRILRVIDSILDETFTTINEARSHRETSRRIRDIMAE